MTKPITHNTNNDNNRRNTHTKKEEEDMQASNIKNDYIAVAMSLHGQFKKYIFLCGCVYNSHLFKGNEIL